jgi:hypothetical protein
MLRPCSNEGKSSGGIRHLRSLLAWSGIDRIADSLPGFPLLRGALGAVGDRSRGGESDFRGTHPPRTRERSPHEGGRGWSEGDRRGRTPPGKGNTWMFSPTRPSGARREKGEGKSRAVSWRDRSRKGDMDVESSGECASGAGGIVTHPSEMILPDRSRKQVSCVVDWERILSDLPTAAGLRNES